MASGSGRFLRDNAFLVAAASLPLVVVLFFLLASVVPRWLTPPPAHDVLVRVDGLYDQTTRVGVAFNVRDGRVEATIRGRKANDYLQRAILLQVDHATMIAREIPLDLPAEMAEHDPPRTFVVEALAGQRVLAEPTAPDGYRLEHRTRRGPGLVGEVFGMNRYENQTALVNRGRVVPIILPPRYGYLSSALLVGWVVAGQNDGVR